MTYIYPDENPNPVLSVSAGAAVLYANAAGADLLQLFSGKTDGTLPDEWGEFIIQVLREGKSKEIEYRTDAQVFLCTFVPVVEKELVNIYAQDVTDIKSIEDELIQRNRELTTLSIISQALTSTLDLQETLDLITDHIPLLLGVDAASVALVDEENNELWYAAASGQVAYFIQGKRLAMGQGITGAIVQNGTVIMIPDVKQDDAFFPGFDIKSNFTTRSILGVPLQVKGETIGVIIAINKKYDDFSKDDLRLLSAIAAPAATAIENGRLFNKAQQEITERKRAEVALQETVTELQITNEQTAVYAQELSREISERKRAQMALAQERSLLAKRVEERTAELSLANAELARASRLKDEFLASMSHELRTPLSAILGKSEALQEGVYGDLNDKQKKSLHSIAESGYHLLSLINDILDLSKVGAGKLELDVHPISIPSVCQSSLRLVKEAAYKKKIELLSEYDLEADMMRADERRLKQILVNLLSNAVKFTPDGGRVTLHVVTDVEREVVRFIVEDTGIGISDKDMSSLFRPFVQLDSSLSRQYVGTGLGLSLVYRMVKLHGGGVAVESDLGKGSRFTIALPWEPIEPKHDDSEPASAAQHYFTSNGPLILLVEDNEANIDVMEKYLQDKGYRVLTARNGEEALDRARESEPHLILMDLQLPEMNGLDVIQRLRSEERFETMPIIATTALAIPGDRERCFKVGTTEYITKPISLRKLVETIQTQLNNHEMQS